MKRVLPLLLSLAFFAPVFSDDTVGGPGGTFISQFLDEGTALTRRSKVNWTGAGVSCVDNSVQKRLDCTVTSTGSGGASATFAVNYNNVLVSSPTSTLNFMPPLTVSLQGSTSAQISLTPISLSTGVVGTVDISTQTNLAATPPLFLTNDTLSISAISLSTGVVGPLLVSSGTITRAYVSTITFSDGTTQNTAAVTSAGDITAVVAGSGLSGGALSGSATLSLDPNATHYIHNQDSLQSGTTAYPGFLKVGTAGAQIFGPLNVDGVITASNTVITTSAGRLDATKLTNTVPNSTLDGSSVTLQGNTFNGANQLVKLDSSADVPDANLSSNVSLLGSSIDISAETNLGVTAPLILTDDTISIDTSTFGGGGSGDITSVTAGTGLSGGGLTGAVTLSLDPNATNYIQNQTAVQQNAGFYVAGSTVGGAFISTGTLTVNSGVAGTGSILTFNPAADNPILNLDTKSTTPSGFGHSFSYLGTKFAEIIPVPAGASGFFIGQSSVPGTTAPTRRLDVLQNGIWRFRDAQGSSFIEFDPVGRSTFTTYTRFLSSMTLSGGYLVQNVAPTNGQVLKFDGTNWKPDTDLNSGGGGGTTIWVKEDGSAVDNSVSTMNFTSGINTTSSPSGQVNVAVDYSTVASRGDVILKQNTLQSGATAYPDFIYNGSSASLKGVTLNDLTASLPIKTDANKKLTAAALDVGSSEATGTLAAARFPALTGDVTTSAGSLATTIASVPNAAIDGSSVTKLGASIDVSGAEITGVLKAASFPALTGDVTTSAGSLTTTVIDDSHNHTVATSSFGVTGQLIANSSFSIQGSTIILGGATYYITGLYSRPAGNRIIQSDSSGNWTWVTDQTAAGGGDNFGSHVATRPVDMAGFPILNVSSIGVNGSGGSFIDIGTNTAMGLVVNGATWYFNTSSITYAGSSSAVLGSNIIISSGGVGAISAATGLTGTLAAAQFPALTGNVTTSAGSLTTTVIDDSHNHTVATSTFAVTGGTFTVTGGTFSINGIPYRWPNVRGSANQVLATDGASVGIQSLSWATDQSGSGGASTLEVFSNFDGTKSSPTASIASGDSLKLSVSGSTATLDVDLSSITAAVGTFTNKTFDAQGTGNVLAFQDTWQWNNADSLFTGTTYYTTTSTNPMYGHGTFAGSNSTSTCGVYIIGNAGADFDTTTDLTMLLYDFTGGVDTSSRTYIVSVATYTTGMNLSTMTYGSPITVTVSNFSVGGINRRGVSASTTLTGWKSVLSANADFAVAIRRQGDSATLDVSTIDSYFGGAIITRGRRQ